MADEGFKRKLSAILSADVKDYSRLMDDDEEATVRTLTPYRSAITDLVQQYRGRVVDTPGDNMLTEFSSVVDAVNCAVEIQRELAERNEELPYKRKMEFRIGINLGDVIEEDGRIYGDGVNIAARVESLADAGGICISSRAYEQVANKLGLDYEDLGEHDVKNISTPIRVYRVLSHPGAAAHRVAKVKKTLGRRTRALAFLSLAAVLIAIGFGVSWQFTQTKHQPPTDPVDMGAAVFPSKDKPSIAVLPFENMTGDPEQKYFSDGMSEQIITGLSQGPYIYVTSRTSSFAFRGKSMTAQQIAEELGVQYILEGSVQRDNDQIRINAQLIEGSDGNHIWAEHYDSNSEDLFALQDKITMEVMTAINVNVTGFQTNASLTKTRPSNLKAYDYYLKAHYYHLGRKTKDIGKARQAVEEAIKLDPNFAAAHNLAGFIYLDEITRRTTKTPEKVLKKAEQTAQKVNELDPSYPPFILWSHIARLKKDADNAILNAEKAVKQAPNHPYNYFFQSMALILGQRFEESKVAIETGLQLIPFRPVNFVFQLAWSYVGMEKFDESIQMFTEVIDRAPKSFFAYLSYKGLAAAYELSGNHEKAVGAAENVMRMNPKYSLEKDRKLSPTKDSPWKDTIFAAYQSAGLK